jgi:hypothetical protein
MVLRPRKVTFLRKVSKEQRLYSPLVLEFDITNIFHLKGEPVTKLKMKKNVFIGEEGHTPLKIQVFNNELAPSGISIATPERLHTTLPERSNLVKAVTPSYFNCSPETKATSIDSTRPKTSRGKSHPSPDDFANYVTTSRSTGIEDNLETVILNLDSQQDAPIEQRQEEISVRHAYNLRGDSRTRESSFSDIEPLGNLAWLIIGTSLML